MNVGIPMNVGIHECWSLTNQCPQTGEFDDEGEDAEADDDEVEDVPRNLEVGADAEADELRERRTGGGEMDELVVRSGWLHIHTNTHTHTHTHVRPVLSSLFLSLSPSLSLSLSSFVSP